ncbi:MAG: CapA family protein [Lachnospiraceae bacterium]|nr:CapA family protein [Lachnospiraceae bacterium]
MKRLYILILAAMIALAGCGTLENTRIKNVTVLDSDAQEVAAENEPGTDDEAAAGDDITSGAGTEDETTTAADVSGTGDDATTVADVPGTGDDTTTEAMSGTGSETTTEATFGAGNDSSTASGPADETSSGTAAADTSKEESEPETITINIKAVGDDLIHSGFYNIGEARGSDYTFMFENVSDVIQEADIAIINQETMFVYDKTKYSGYPTFGSPTGIGDALIAAGFDVVQLATNHSLDKGLTGINNTVDYFSDKDVLAIGIYTDEESASEIPLMEVAGVTFAFLNYTYGTNGIAMPNSYCVNTFSDEDKVRDDIRRAKELADIVVVLPHWGTEYTYTPDSFQKKWTQIFLEEGVDIVIGTHPHVVQPYEMLTGEDGHQMLVYYSLGNFISWQSKMERMLGGMADITITITVEDGTISYDYDLVPLVTYIHSGTATTTYFLSDYDKTDHTYGATKENMTELFEKIINWEM